MTGHVDILFSRINHGRIQLNAYALEHGVRLTEREMTWQHGHCDGACVRRRGDWRAWGEADRET